MVLKCCKSELLTNPLDTRQSGKTCLLFMKLTIPKQISQPVVDWANNSYTQFKANGDNRQFCTLVHGYCPIEVWEIKKIIENRYDLAGKVQEPMFRDFCGYILDGGQVHRHQDLNSYGLIHTRFNVLLSKPEFGGTPVINGVALSIEENEVWVCKAGLYQHETTRVQGSKPRIVLSFGYLL